MASKYISLDNDINRLTTILSEVTETDIVYIYADSDKRKPQNAITYHHLDTIPQLEKAGQIKTLYLGRNIDENAPGYGALPYYQVKILIEERTEQMEVWPLNFKWVDKTTFRAGEFGEIEFFVNSNRLNIFKILTEKKFDWAEVREIYNKTKIKEADIRTTINHITKRLNNLDNESERHLTIIPRKKAPGAYRLTIVSKQNLESSIPSIVS